MSVAQVQGTDTREAATGPLRELVAEVLDEARRQGASGAEAAVGTAAGLSVTVRMGEVESIEHQHDKGMGVTVYLGRCTGAASTSDLRPAALRETVAAACRIARYTGEDPCNGLAEAALMACDPPDLDLYHRWVLSPEQAVALATQCEHSARGLDPRITNSDGASVGVHEGSRIYGNSHGFVGVWHSTRHSLSARVIARDGTGMQRDYWYSASRDPAALETPEAVGRTAAQRALARLGARRLSTCSAPVLLSADVAASLFGHFIGAVRGSSLYRRASFLLGQLDQQVFPAGFRLHEQPHLPGAMGSAAFDNEGVATRARDLVADGILRGYVLDSYSACRLGMQTTGNAGGVHNVCIAYRSCEPQALMAEMGTGLLVTELMGMGVNTVTGDYSRGAAGFWVEGGVIQYPVHEITIAGNLKEMFQGIRGVANDVDTRGNIRTGSVLVERMAIAGT